jgi:Na+/proline symporter
MLCLLFGLWALLFGLAWFVGRSRRESAEGFMVAGRHVGLGFGSASLLAGWIWALSLYAPAQAGYQYGIAGPVYYSAGGALMLIVFMPFVRRIRELVPEGHTIAEYVGARFGRAAHLLTVLITLVWTVVILYFNLSVVGYMVSSFSGVDYETGIVIVALIAVSYSLLSGLKASILTDAAQFGAISLAGLILAPIVISRFGGPSALVASLETLGDRGDPFSMRAFLQMGLPWMLLGLVGAFSYQSVWQKAWAIRADSVSRAYLIAGAGWFPYSLAFGVFGVIALAAGIPSAAGDGSDITPVVAAHYLTSGESVLFVVLVLAAACSTCDGALCAFSSILMTDVIRGYLAPTMAGRRLLRWGRLGIVFVGSLGALLAFQKESLLQLLFLLGAARVALAVPLLTSLYWRRATQAGYVYGVLGGVICGVTAAATLHSVTPYHSLISLLLGLGVSGGICALFALTSRGPRFEFDTLRTRVRKVSE